MGWRGRTNVSTKLGGRHGGLVRLGDTVVPRKVEFTVEGEGGEPDLHMLFEVRDGRPECVELTITTKPEGRGIRTADLALFNIDGMAVNVFTQFAMVRDDPPSDGSIALRPLRDDAEVRQAGRGIAQARKRRHGKVTRAELEEVARVYRENVASSPTRAVYELLYSGKSERTAARRVEQARAAGLLPATTPGKRKA